MPEPDPNETGLFILCCPRCGNSLYDPVKRLCPSVPAESQGDIFCKQCHWIGQPDALIRHGLELEASDEAEEEEAEEEEFRWEVER